MKSNLREDVLPRGDDRKTQREDIMVRTTPPAPGQIDSDAAPLRRF